MTSEPTAPTAGRTPRSKPVMWGLIAGTAVSLLILPLALMWAAFSVMASDAGTTPAVQTFILLSFLIPVGFVLGPILAWVSWFLRRDRLAIALLFLPLIPFATAIGVMASA